MAVAVWVRELVVDDLARQKMREALRRWHRPDAADRVADCIMTRMGWVAEVQAEGQPKGESTQRQGGELRVTRRGSRPESLWVARREPQRSGQR
jgi:hypothetical protein